MVQHKKNKSQKGGKILGTGRDGAVADPPLLCSTKMSAINKVSKMINVSGISKRKFNDFVNEYKFGQIFRNADPNNEHFLPGIDMCTFTDTDPIVPEQIRKDIKTAGYKKGNKPTHILNIIMKKGQDFKDITANLSKENILKSMAYLLQGAEVMVYDLKVCHLDVKYPNLLYSKDDGDDRIYPVFIDFSADFVIRDLASFKKFILGFGASTDYWIWPAEINALFYHFETMGMSQREINKNKYLQKFRKGLRDNKGIDIESTNGHLFFESITDYAVKSLNKQYSLIGLYNKMMVYEIGMAYYDSLEKTKFKKDKDIMGIINAMLDEDVTTRPYISDVKNMIKKHMSYKNRNDLMINLKNEKKGKAINKKVKKAVQAKNVVKNARKTPSLPSGIILSRMTPLSQRSYKSKPHQSPVIIPPPGMKKVKKVKKKLKPVGLPIGSPNQKKVKKSSKSVSTNCMKIKVVDIKKSQKYKNLPKSAGKSKLKKAELCALLQKKTGRPAKDYSKMKKSELYNLIKLKL